MRGAHASQNVRRADASDGDVAVAQDPRPVHAVVQHRPRAVDHVRVVSHRGQSSRRAFHRDVQKLAHVARGEHVGGAPRFRVVRADDGILLTLDDHRGAVPLVEHLFEDLARGGVVERPEHGARRDRGRGLFQRASQNVDLALRGVFAVV
eukprot:31197-Pelagococcus_subviridis.AAC.33